VTDERTDYVLDRAKAGPAGDAGTLGGRDWPVRRTPGFRRPARHGRVVAAIVHRDYIVMRSYRLTFALDAFSGVVFLATYYFISKTFEGAPTADLNGAPSYFAFAAVGAAIGAVIDTASTGIAGRIREEQLTGTLEMLAVQPVTSLDLCVGLVGFPFLFGLFRAALYLIIAGIWMNVSVTTADWPGIVIMFFLTGAALATLGIFSGALVLLFKRGAVLAGLVLFSMALVSGSVFPVSTLPSWLEPIGRAMPMRFAFDGVRSALFRGEGWGWDALWLAVFGVVGIPIAVFAFDRALHYTKRRAALGQY
jgi:ABC-2 type transport system permease protein